MSKQLNSGLYVGQIRHRRFSPKQHEFSYGLFMVAIDVDEIPQLTQQSRLFGTNWWSPLRFKQSDYMKNKSDPTDLKKRIKDKALELGESREIDKIILVAQCRCFGLYFSPVNFYFCYSQNKCVVMIAEVSNTPWNQTHYYLVNLDVVGGSTNKKDFHVSPFMPIDMTYHWRVSPPKSKLLVHIENHKTDKVFDATLTLKKTVLNRRNLLKVLFKHPLMTFKIVLGIYWQAAKLFAKRIPFIANPKP
ncbi:DUF1365 domain-containing protein [Psychrosphaera sp. B3R10]|uniref:DUF1365 domain-containing protein n=1 Tax=Psychrosphaera algicola TaxID=3023714 RepID=A0ABT5FCL3_9GAMM|nr:MULTISPECIES: DUF1365 domain-containing protein [unclassified Psychrosphaera]MBU2882441.1 DUF1365 domain-containing protein [Psychrosphaera sp. I2R16]MBU2990262.1 DUF1365 domain-containing protein [Psychrosphaera sp. B3R10]MDC2889268.1 DUF1365 domain-containing protein [Psychrosphaera sp. G1-22]MDO6721296.1 DUF1365 domain-containing protein [Psychrosphaera sp. 1_MG-2023]